MRLNVKLLSVFLCLMIIGILCVPLAFSKDVEFLNIEIEKVSRYYEDRIAYLHVEKGVSPNLDNSIASLLIIKDKKIYLLQDGYENPKDVQTKILIANTENRLLGEIWTNKINGKPDYIRLTERRVELLKNFDEEFVSKNFGNFYTSVRNAFLQKHVKIFKQLMIDRKESGLVVERNPVPKPTYVGAPTDTKYSITVVGKTIDEKLYYAEDADGDGITETFYVNSADGFNWGYKSGPNIILILNNKDEAVKQIVGELAKGAYYGTPEEEKQILDTFPKDAEIIQKFELEKAASAGNK